MPLMAPVFRELNFQRIETLAKTLSNSTIANIITDETGIEWTRDEIRSVRKFYNEGSKKALISKATIKAINNENRLGDQNGLTT